MSPTQIEALSNIITDPAKVQEVWDKPRVFKFPTLNGRTALIVTCAVKQSTSSTGYQWMTCVRIFHNKKRHVKPPETWTPFEETAVGLVLTNELVGVGKDDDSRQYFNSQWARHLVADLTTEELSLSLRKDLLGNGNGHKPGVIVTEHSAMELVDKLVKESEEPED
jgi:hypothetical protein